AAAAAAARDAATAAATNAADRVARAEDRLRELDDRVRSLNVELREMDADEAGRSGHRSHVQRAYAEMETQEQEWRAEAERTRAEAATAREERARLAAEREDRRRERERAAALRVEREAAWDEVREEASELRVEHARAESALSDLDRRIAATDEAVENGRRRLSALDEEEADHHATLERQEGTRREAGERLEALFEERDRLSEDLRAHDERLAEAEAETTELEAKLRELRRSVEEHGETRHRLELQRAEVAANRRGIRDRLEAEWGRSFDRLVDEAEPVELDEATLRSELAAVTADLERLGPVNMLAIEQHEEEKERLEFLTDQREDLVQARDDLETAIREINRKARTRFMETFEAIRANFHTTFGTLFDGGECDLWLDDADDPLESPIEISASPAGKRTQRIHLLSGGERALTSLALLFAIYLVKPSPFCVLDEVDAPLDEANIDRLLRMLERFKESTQFIVITHNPRTIEAADWIYGVTMEEPGISSIVGVQLDEVLAELGAVTA
ncbi:MAG: AAA family ATPase, partial [Gemmatimonadota bacterium]